MGILETIHSNSDLQRLNDSDRERLCREIREFLVNSVAQTGGHLASNLGIVELSVALETVFDTSKDRLVFDVGHQSYVHKLLTGRQADFAHLRQFGGIAGFPKPCESQSDAFVAGHASSSVSIALGMARARTLRQEDYHVVALLGDGAATGGMIYEALNDAAVSREPLVIILNDNAMSIDRNVGGIARHLKRLRSTEEYLGMKQRYASFLGKVPGGKWIFKVTSRIKEMIKRALIPSTIFENMGLDYLGPVDGHDLPELISLLRIARDWKRPVLIHVLTTKGKGYPYAEENPALFHGIGKFDPQTGRPLKDGCTAFSDTFGATMLALAERDQRVCAITAAMPGGTGLLRFKEQYPKRLFDVGIAEEHAVSMAGGLAKQGMIPVVAIYSTFLQRSYDMILQDIAMLGLHAVFAVDRAGLVGEDGETHHGIFDVGFLRQAPGLTLLCPASQKELADMLAWAVEEQTGPVAIRYPRGGDRGYSDSAWLGTDKRVVCHRRGGDVAIVTYGVTVSNALAASEILREQGIAAGVFRLLSAAPIPAAELVEELGSVSRVVMIEETIHGAGISEALSEELHRLRPGCSVACRDLGTRFVTHGTLEDLYRHYGLDGAGIAALCREVLEK